MKLLLLLFLASILSFAASAQESRLKAELSDKLLLAPGLKQLSYTLSKPKPGVYALPLDNMPCIVPDTKDIAAMPNAWRGLVLRRYNGAIPNPALPKSKSDKIN